MARVHRSVARVPFLLFSLWLALPACRTPTALPVATRAAERPAPRSPDRSAFVNLFMWRWTDVARECEVYLGPKGFAAVQISPPQEHALKDGNPWWIHYQPVSYRLESELGTRAEFADMVHRCRAAGVEIYADAVINHMARDAGKGYAGSTYTNEGSQYTFPGIYSPRDFHWNVDGPHSCQSHGIEDYNNRHAVQDCELERLPDLATETDHVRERLADYLTDLHALGVRGYRIDGAKHMDPADIEDVLARLDARIGGTRDYFVVQEVIDPGGQAINKARYYRNGWVNEFLYGKLLKRKFAGGELSSLGTLGETWYFGGGTLGPSGSMVVFLTNHDMQRSGSESGQYLQYWDEGGGMHTFLLANVFMLAWPYGLPQIFSGYDIPVPGQESRPDESRPDQPVYESPNAREPKGCRWNGGPWVCEHRWREIGNMVAWRNVAGGAPVANWWSEGGNRIAFSRGTRAFVAINRDGNDLQRAFQTGLPAGTYCDVISGDLAGGACSGRIITVDSAGLADVLVPRYYAAAIHVGARID